MGVSSSASATSSCSINNAMKNTTYNQAAASGTSNNTVKGMFATIVGSFAAIIGIIVIGVIILFVIGAFGYAGVKGASALSSKPQNS